MLTSARHMDVKSPVNFERLSSPDGEKEMPWLGRYSISKLVAIQFTQSLQRLLANESIYVNCCNPGAVATDFNRDIEAKFGMISVYLLALLQKLFFQSVQIGALTQLYLATSPEVEDKGISGQYFWPVAMLHTSAANSLALDETEQKKYWDWCEGVVDAALKRVD